ncbi:hypothetical protein SDC9_156552 [bioreactor metagenome]|uniref:Uncharacterized protein n=1 Tax=bioreactor metagenome TaxID=1076179 RepID=A0A645F9X0_9ZZZZ
MYTYGQACSCNRFKGFQHFRVSNSGISRHRRRHIYLKSANSIISLLLDIMKPIISYVLSGDSSPHAIINYGFICNLAQLILQIIYASHRRHAAAWHVYYGGNASAGSGGSSRQKILPVGESRIVDMCMRIYTSGDHQLLTGIYYFLRLDLCLFHESYYNSLIHQDIDLHCCVTLWYHCVLDQ